MDGGGDFRNYCYWCLCLVLVFGDGVVDICIDCSGVGGVGEFGGGVVVW